MFLIIKRDKYVRIVDTRQVSDIEVITSPKKSFVTLYFDKDNYVSITIPKVLNEDELRRLIAFFVAYWDTKSMIDFYDYLEKHIYDEESDKACSTS